MTGKNMNDLLRLVDPQWQVAFMTFIRGEEFADARDEARFVEYLEHDRGCQRAVELAIARVATALQGEMPGRRVVVPVATPAATAPLVDDEPQAAGTLSCRR